MLTVKYIFVLASMFTGMVWAVDLNFTAIDKVPNGKRCGFSGEKDETFQSETLVKLKKEKKLSGDSIPVLSR